LAVAGVAASYTGVVPPFTGFLVLVLGLATGLAGFVTSVVGISATRPHKRRLGRRRAIQGLFMSLAVVVMVLAPAVRVGDKPRINDITTDTADPPVFVSAATLEDNRGRDMTYPGESFAAQQKQGYPTLSSLVLDMPPDAAFDKARSAVASMDSMKIVGESREEGRIEAVQTSALFHFRDDIVVRIRPHEGGSKIDVRSKSRVGKGDQGANAARIRDFYERMRWR
jgi:uncharacterized protein (DUF1499 family)